VENPRLLASGCGDPRPAQSPAAYVKQAAQASDRRSAGSSSALRSLQRLGPSASLRHTPILIGLPSDRRHAPAAACEPINLARLQCGGRRVTVFAESAFLLRGSRATLLKPDCFGRAMRGTGRGHNDARSVRPQLRSDRGAPDKGLCPTLHAQIDPARVGRLINKRDPSAATCMSITHVSVRLGRPDCARVGPAKPHT
jgi:hypothetical protein